MKKRKGREREVMGKIERKFANRREGNGMERK